jgi:hypothetical protein
MTYQKLARGDCKAVLRAGAADMEKHLQNWTTRQAHTPLAMTAWERAVSLMNECDFGGDEVNLGDRPSQSEYTASCASTTGCEVAYVNMTNFVDFRDALEEAGELPDNPGYVDYDDDDKPLGVLGTMRELGMPVCAHANFTARYIENGACVTFRVSCIC